MSNYWDKFSRKMRCHSSKKFKILIGDNNPLVYHKNPSKNINEKPQINKQTIDRRKYMDDLHFLLTEDGMIQIYTTNMNFLLSTKQQIQQGSDIEDSDDYLAWQPCFDGVEN